MIPPLEARARTILRTIDGRVFVYPVVSKYTAIILSKDGSTFGHLTDEGVRQWNSGEEVTSIYVICRTPSESITRALD